MKIELFVTSIFFLTCFFVSAQQTLPIINATSKTVSIRDGNILQKNSWTISPELKPDVHKTSSNRVTFITDRDSITFKIKHDKVYNFVILLNNKDSAFTQIKYVPTFLDVLKKADKYNYLDNREILKFRCQIKDDPELKAISQKFKLDSIAGTGNEISQLLNVLHWVHNTYPHNGSIDVPYYHSTLELMTITKNEHKTLECGTLATVLNKCYLALGFKSRRVICLPKDSTDVDCHSINAVYSNTLNKWVWVDPTNDAYVMNEQGVLLSIAEVRERLINGKTLIINPDANWNHKSSTTKEYYLYNYMAKNLYAFQCFCDPEGGSITNVLLPLEYKGIIPRTANTKPKCTNNPNVFWAKPE
jgi:hypothetical protein